MVSHVDIEWLIVLGEWLIVLGEWFQSVEQLHVQWTNNKMGNVLNAYKAAFYSKWD